MCGYGVELVVFMRISKMTPETIFGSTRPIHYTGHADTGRYIELLGSDTAEALHLLLATMSRIALSNRHELCVLGVGSRADITYRNQNRNLRHHDVDLVIATSPEQQRVGYQDSLRMAVATEGIFRIIERNSVQPFLPVKWAIVKGDIEFDATFLGLGGGSILDLMQFHTYYNLAHTYLYLTGLRG